MKNGWMLNLFSHSQKHMQTVKNNCFRIVYYADYNFIVVSHITYIMPANKEKTILSITFLTVTELPKISLPMNSIMLFTLIWLTFNLEESTLWN